MGGKNNVPINIIIIKTLERRNWRLLRKINE